MGHNGWGYDQSINVYNYVYIHYTFEDYFIQYPQHYSRGKTITHFTKLKQTIRPVYLGKDILESPKSMGLYIKTGKVMRRKNKSLCD